MFVSISADVIAFLVISGIMNCTEISFWKLLGSRTQSWTFDMIKVYMISANYLKYKNVGYPLAKTCSISKNAATNFLGFR